jgi:hypothetical protein
VERVDQHLQLSQVGQASQAVRQQPTMVIGMETMKKIMMMTTTTKKIKPGVL